MRILLLAGAVLAFVPMNASAQITTQDLGFIAQTRHGNMTELQEAQIAQANAASPAVKDFAQHMIQDHTLHDQELAAMLKAAGIPLIPLSAAPDEVQQQTDLRRLSGAEFDRAYLQAQVKNHRKMQEVMQGEVQAGNDPNLKEFARRSIPVVTDHLTLAQRLLGTG